jgi:hypothetical protein
MSESTRPPHKSRDERGSEAAREEIVEAERLAAQVAALEASRLEEEAAVAEILRRRQEAAAAEILRSAQQSGETGVAWPPDPVAQIVRQQLEGIGDKLSSSQRTVLADLLRLHLSLRGPQDLLESTGNFNRPVFPSPPRYRGQ